ncbi:MAG: M23 family metallopeptidase [Alistipes sp.]|nr:M23 family metallopeptidase [Alistipes sp.]
MRYFLTLILSAAVAATAAAQSLPHGDYEYPVRDVQRLYSANFGEMRPNHFHSGVDIKTDGVTGKRVVAVADGYVSRIVVQPGGYGRALYVTHPDGTTSVYGHLQSFRPDIEKYVREERIRRRSNRVDLYFNKWEWEVERGQTIAFSGNTGTSYGPHLHFELRETATQRTMNTIAEGIIPVTDNLPPVIARLHYVEVDTVGCVPVHSRRRSYDVRRQAPGIYILATERAVDAGRNGYFIVEVSDRKNGVQNTFGVYRVSCAVDGEKRFEYRMDGFTFDCTRYCNAAACYDMQLSSRNEVMRLARLEGSSRGFYTTLVDDGAISLADGETAQVRIEAEDDCGNLSQLEFTIRGKADGDCFRAPAEAACGETIDRRRDFSHADSLLTIEIPAGTLYESAFFECRHAEKRPKADSSLVVLSAVSSIMTDATPMHRGAKLALRCDVPQRLRSRAVLARLNRKGRPVYAGGRYDDGAVRGTITSFGDYFVAADTVAPKVSPRFKQGADLSSARSLSFSVGDNFSGVASYEGTIDGEWAIFEYMPVGGRLIHNFTDSSLARGKRHTVRITVRDNCGNSRTVECDFYR